MYVGKVTGITVAHSIINEIPMGKRKRKIPVKRTDELILSEE